MANSHVQAFVEQLWPHAVEIGDRYGLDPVTIVTQAAIETGWGEEVAGNNYFGVKSHGQPGGQTITTHEEIDGKRVKVQDSFRVYDSLEESMEDYAQFLHENPRYANALRQQGYQRQLEGITGAGYATDSNYLNLVRGVSGMVADAAPPTPPGSLPTVATELSVRRPAPVPAPASQRPRMVAPRPVTMSAALRKRRSTSVSNSGGPKSDLSLSGRPNAVTPRLRDDGEILTYHIPDITHTAVVGGMGSLTPGLGGAKAPDTIAQGPSGPANRGRPAAASKDGVIRTANALAGNVALPAGVTPVAARQLMDEASSQMRTDGIGDMPSWADMNAFANNDSDIPKYITSTVQLPPLDPPFTGASEIKGPNGRGRPVLKTVQRLNPDWVQAQQAAAKTAVASVSKSAAGTKPGSFGEQLIGGVRQAIGLPAEGLGPSIRGAVLDAFGLGPGGFKGPQVLGLGNGLRPGDRRYDPSTNTWVVKPGATPMRPPRAGGSNATGLSGGQGLYQAGGYVYAARPGGGYQKVGKVGQPIPRSSGGGGGSSSGGGGGGGTSGLRPGDRRYNADTNRWEVK